MSKRTFELYGVYPDHSGESDVLLAIVMQLKPLNIARLLESEQQYKIPIRSVSTVRNPSLLGELICVLSVDQVRVALLAGGWDPRVVDEEIR